MLNLTWWTGKTVREQIYLVVKLWGIMWVLAVLSGLHGFSLPVWRWYLGEPGYKVIFGGERDFRSDDWQVAIPLSLSQIKADPPFPVINPLIGDGQNMLVIPTVPVLNQVTLFRPHTWGYFIGPDFGLSWNWNFYVYSFLYAYFFLFLLCSRNAVFISAAGAVALLFTPFFQFWSLNSAAMAAEAAFCTVLAYQLIQETRTRNIFAISLLLGWALACFTYWLYPAFQVPMMYVCLAIFIGLLWRKYRSHEQLNWSVVKTIGLLLAILIPTTSVYIFYPDAREAIYTLSHTVYPGQRLSTGGNLPLWKLFINNLIPLRWVGQYEGFGNPSEAASSILIYPLIIIVLFYDSYKNRTGTIWNRLSDIDPVVISLSVILLWLTAWLFIPMPVWLAKLTLFSYVPEYRSIIGHTVANMALLITCSSLYFKTVSLKKIDWGIALFWTCTWTILMMALFPAAMAISNDYGPIRLSSWILFALGVSMLTGFSVGLRFRYLVVIICALNLFLSFNFNPIVRGGSSIFESSLLGKMVLRVQNPHSQENKWLMVGDSTIAMFLRSLGLHTLNGNFMYPQWDFWKKLDPEGKYTQAYNRYANLIVNIVPDIEDFSITLPYADNILLQISVDDPRFKMLDVNYVLSLGPLILTSDSPLELIDQTQTPLNIKAGRGNSYYLYRLKENETH